MNQAHQRFHDWLTAGAEGDPPRDVAVHASVCPECRASIASLDRLATVNPGMASMPAEPTGREPWRLAMAGRLVGATAVLFSATILGVGGPQLIGVSHPNDPVAQTSRTPDQDVLGETATPQASQPTGTPSPPQETLTPLGTPVPTLPPGATPFPWIFNPLPFPTPGPFATPPPTPPPPTPPPPTPPPSTPPPSPSGGPSDTPLPTESPSSVPSPSSSSVPTATPSADADGDGVNDTVEVQYGSNPTNPASTPENLGYNPSTCSDSADNDLDGSADVFDSGCL